MELALIAPGHEARVIEDCLNGRRTVGEDPYKPGRNGLIGVEQRIEANSPLTRSAERAAASTPQGTLSAWWHDWSKGGGFQIYFRDGNHKVIFHAASGFIAYDVVTEVKKACGEPAKAPDDDEKLPL